MKKLFVLTSVFFLALGITTFASAAPIDLSTWTPTSLAIGGQGLGNWVLGAGNTSVVQTNNSDPSFFLNNTSSAGYKVDGSWKVRTDIDGDYMGFVFGYQNSSNFYLFDWKKDTQDFAGQTAAEGMTIKKMTGATGDGVVDLSIAEFWENQVDLGDMEILGMNQGAGTGWVTDELYAFHLDFNVIVGQFTINVKDSLNTVLWNVTINDATFTDGEFGFYNFSQQDVEYVEFEQEEVPEPVTMLLFGTGLAGLGGFSLRRKKK